MSNRWKQDFFEQLNDLARFRKNFIYDPKKIFGTSTDELEKTAGLTHTAWNISECDVRLNFYYNYDGNRETRVAENKLRFEASKKFKTQIEALFGEPLDYNPGSSHQRIVSKTQVAASESNQSDWPQIQSDLLDRFERLRTVLTQFPPFTAVPPSRKTVVAPVACRARLPDVDKKAVTQLQSPVSNIYPDEIPDGATFQEGARKTVTVNAYERNPKARKKCIKHYGTACYVCGFDFGRVYGQKGQGIIHVHHITPISEMNGPHQVDPINDLRPVCPNCHTMLHASTPAMGIDALKTLLQRS